MNTPRRSSFGRVFVLAVLAVAACDSTSPTDTDPEVVSPDGPSLLLVPGAAFTQVSAGNSHTCAVRSDGVVECWGDNGFGRAPAQRTATASSFTGVSAGGLHTCAVREDGVVECWGLNSSGQAPPVKAAAASRFEQVDAGTDHTCAVRADGVVECWGNNNLGKAPSAKSAASGTFVQVTAAAVHTCGARSDGVVECWGSSSSGQAPAIRAAVSGAFAHATAGSLHTCALRTDGVTECWGSNNSGRAPPTKAAALGLLTQVSAGFTHTCARRDDGVVDCWGNSLSGQAPATRSAASGSFTQVTGGGNHTCALRTDGIVQCWGSNTDGQAPSAKTTSSRVRVLPVAAFQAPTAVDEGSTALLALTDASVPGHDGSPFRYAFDCGSGYGAFSAANTATCDAPDGPAVLQVKGSVRDREGDTQEYSAVVTVDNVAPVVEALVGAEIPVSGTYAEHGYFDDPGIDTHSATVDYGTGSGAEPLPLAGEEFSLSHAYNAPGAFTVVLSVTDSDGATKTRSAIVTVLAPEMSLADLFTAVEVLRDSGALTKGWGPRMIQDLRQVEKNLEKGRPGTALSHLADFISKVEACLGSRMLTADQAMPLIEAAEQIADAIRASG